MNADSGRYLRQMALPEVGEEGQKLLGEARVLIIGAGGLGSPAALYLAAAGVGTLGLIDPDRVDLSNLQRQVLFHSSQENQPKVLAAAKNLGALNPHTQVRTFQSLFSPENARAISREFDVLVDGTDNFAAKFLLGDVSRSFGIPLVHGTVSGFEGRVAVFQGKEGPCFRCLYPTSPKAHIPNCSQAGVLGAVAGTIGCLQAVETIKWIIQTPRQTPPCSRPFRMLVLDAWNMIPRVFDLERRDGCQYCASDFDPLRPEYSNNQPSCEPPNQSLSADEVRSKLPACTLIDIREHSEWNRGRIPGALHWPLKEIVDGEHVFDRNVHYVLYCHSGVRSASALELLRQRGNHNISHLRGGILAWGAPITK